jgi:hypothetical protein
MLTEVITGRIRRLDVGLEDKREGLQVGLEAIRRDNRLDEKIKG